MPELPEVETVVRDLRPMLVGKRFGALKVGKLTLRRQWREEWQRHLIGPTIRAVQRRGKWILIDLDGPWLVVHLGMTGQFRVMPANEPTETHTHFVFSLSPGSEELRFRDVRRFGSISVFADQVNLDAFFAECGLGPEPFDLAKTYWREQLAKSRRCVKAVLLDQSVVAGVGNIYADESLFRAKLHPGRPACELTAREAESLRQAIVIVLNAAIRLRGSTIRDYIGGSGLRGGFQSEFQAYGRDGDPCSRCKTTMEVMRLAGRSTHYCPKCQKR